MSADAKFDFSQVPKFAPIKKKEYRSAIKEVETVSSNLTDSSELDLK